LCTNLENALGAAVPARQGMAGAETVSFWVCEGEQKGCYTLTVDLDEVLPVIAGCTTCCLDGNTYIFKWEEEYLKPAEGQAISERTFLLPPKKIVSARSATAEMYSEANSTLADDFIMQTDTVAAGTVVWADFTEEEEIDLSTRYGEMEIDKAIERLLLDVGGDLEVSAECRRIDQNGVEFPLFLQLPTRDTPAALAAAWSGKMFAWLDTVPPAIRSGSVFTFRLNLRFGNVLKIPRVLVRIHD